MKRFIFNVPETSSYTIHNIEAMNYREALLKLIDQIVDPTVTLEEAKGFSFTYRLERVEEL